MNILTELASDPLHTVALFGTQELASSYLFKTHFDTTQESMVDNFYYPPTLKLCIKLGEHGTTKMEVKVLVFSIFIFFSLCLSISDPAGNYFIVDRFWHDQWQADHMPTAPSCHDFSSPVGTHFCAHCLHAREGVHPEKVAFGSLPLSEEPDVLCVLCKLLTFYSGRMLIREIIFITEEVTRS